MPTRDDFVNAARAYIGTPWHHRGRLPGVAIDCGGIVVCALRDTKLRDPDFDVDEYDIRPDGHSLIDFCERDGLKRVSRNDIQPADLVITSSDERPQHIGVFCLGRYGERRWIHATNDRRYMRAIEQRLLFSRHQKFEAAYSIPGLA